jgi:acetyl esterase/lipase
VGGLARVGGVLNLWVAPLPINVEGGKIVGATQLTSATDRDICFSFRFTYDDFRVLYIRETKHGSELYHLFSLDLSDTNMFPVESGQDLLASYPHMTCAVGFVGGLQLWLCPITPNVVTLSTGRGSLLWDLSTLNLDTGELTVIQQNPASSKLGLFVLAVKWCAHIATRILCSVLSMLTLGVLRLSSDDYFSPPAVPLQYFVNGMTGELVGRAECCVSFGIAMAFSCLSHSDKDTTEPGQWVRVGPSIPLEALNMQLVGSGGATGTMRLDILERGRVAVHTCCVGDTTAYVEYPSGNVIASHPKADIDGFITNPTSGLVDAILATTAHTEIIPLNSAGEKFKQEVMRVSLALGLAVDTGDVAMVTSRTLNDDIWVLCSRTDTEAGTYYLHYDPYTAKTPTFLLSSRPAISAYSLVASQAVDIPARDGEALPCYLTLPDPVGKRNTRNSSSSSSSSRSEKKQKTPLAIFLHGGPSARDYAGYDPVVQLLVSRGIAVLKVNYRGSTGYGMRYLKLGSGNIQGMHNDVEDARLWAIETGVADENRIAIIGASWGGYLALGAATRLCESTPSTSRDVEERDADIPKQHHPYAAVVAIVPCVSVGAANTSKAFRGDPLVARYWKDIYGPKVSGSRTEAMKMSPLYHLQHLSGTKLLLVHGEDDVRVPREHGDEVASQAYKMRITGAYVTYAHEGHHIKKEPNMMHMWHEVEKFLCRSLLLSESCSILDPKYSEGNTATMHWMIEE